MIDCDGGIEEISGIAFQNLGGPKSYFHESLD